jgi:hypothetical protein
MELTTAVLGLTTAELEWTGAAELDSTTAELSTG